MPYSVFGWYNEFLGEKQPIGVKIAARVLVSYKIDLLFTLNIGKISYHLLKDNLVDIYKAEEGSRVKDIIECYRPQPASAFNMPYPFGGGAPGSSPTQGARGVGL